MNYDRPELLDRLAAGYVLGTMTQRVRRRFDAIRRRVPAAERAVLDWERRLMPLSRPVPPQAPPARVWAAIDRRTGGAPAIGRAPAAAWLAWLKPALGFALGAVAAFGVVRMYPTDFVPVDRIVQERGTLPASYVGLLTDTAGNPVVLASSTRHGRTLSIKMLRKPDVPQGKVLQLWALPQNAAPFPLGVLPLEGKGIVTMADTSEKLLSNVPRLVVTLENAPAAAGATPGEPLLSGHCVKLW